jgi:hypothetical protein
MKYVTGFFQFWWDFLVGDSVALAFGGITVLVLGYALVEAGLNTAAQVMLPITVAATIWASLPSSSR